jgi:hypothetical protein
MTVALGPMPANVRAVVGRLVVEARRDHPETDQRLNGFLLTGGPGGCSYLDADGEVWNWSAWDDSVERVEDGPLKVGLVAIAAERVPELGEWLPRRPVAAPDCQTCAGSGWLPPPWPRVQCPECSGLGWSSAEGRA